jgi:hypothetical protein
MRQHETRILHTLIAFPARPPFAFFLQIHTLLRFRIKRVFIASGSNPVSVFSRSTPFGCMFRLAPVVHAFGLPHRGSHHDKWGLEVVRGFDDPVGRNR